LISTDFDNHLEKDHKLLHYLYFFAYLKDQIHNGELSASEKLLAAQIDSRKLDFFPIEKAISLEGTDNSRVLCDNCRSPVHKHE
jgi:hypothetical protein